MPRGQNSVLLFLVDFSSADVLHVSKEEIFIAHFCILIAIWPCLFALLLLFISPSSAFHHSVHNSIYSKFTNKSAPRSALYVNVDVPHEKCAQGKLPVKTKLLHTRDRDMMILVSGCRSIRKYESSISRWEDRSIHLLFIFSTAFRRNNLFHRFFLISCVVVFFKSIL